MEINMYSQCKVNFNTGVISVLVKEDSTYRDTIEFSKEERSAIAEAFNKRKMFELKGHYAYAGDIVIMPPSTIDIKIFAGNKPKGEIRVFYDAEINKWFPFGTRYNVIKFTDELKKLIESKKEYKIAQQVSVKSSRGFLL
ncbi:hypothetical protein [Mucilaginibacter hurinus]|nr:hypothetical protein [Mucilaginibacter hurinus]